MGIRASRAPWGVQVLTAGGKTPFLKGKQLSALQGLADVLHAQGMDAYLYEF